MEDRARNSTGLSPEPWTAVREAAADFRRHIDSVGAAIVADKCRLAEDLARLTAKVDQARDEMMAEFEETKSVIRRLMSGAETP